MPGANSIDEYESYVRELSLDALRDIENNIDRIQYPERFSVLQAEIEKRKPEQDRHEELEIKNEKYHTFWRRFFAGILDAFIFFPISWILDFIQNTLHLSFFAILISIISTYSFLAYSVLLHGYLGQTLGKMICKVKVLDISEKSLSMRQALIRDLVPILLISFFIPIEVYRILHGIPMEELIESNRTVMWFAILFGMGHNLWFFAELITMLTNSKRRAIHDFLARSVVIKI